MTRSLLAVALAQIAAVAFFPALRFSPRQRVVVLVAVCIPIVLTPLLIPSDARVVRFLAAVMAVALSVKLCDLHVGANRGTRPDLWTFLFFLPNVSVMVLRKIDHERKVRGVDGERRRLTRSVAGLVVGAGAVLASFSFDWNRSTFFLEHTVKAVAVFLSAISFVAVLVGAARLAGWPARRFTEAPFPARTPADFWRRYNRSVQQFYYEDVFKPVGGLHWPIGATLLIFALSAVIHEYAFGMAMSRVQGYQTVFFLLQGCAVAGTVRLKPSGWTAILAVVATIAFNITTSVFFFASANSLVPFYAHPLPGWLQGW